MNLLKISHLIYTSLLSSVTAISLLCPVAISAKSTTEATSSGNTSGNEMNTITSSGCSGSQKVSGLDATIFSKITPDNQGTIVCSKSDGFKTVATGQSKVNNYHWTAWYKNSLQADVDRTQGTGNYHGFPASKVEEWKQYAENIKKLNGGKFPDSKNYVYPTDTKDGKLDFWGDIAGYYGVLGDPQYATIHLEAFQQFSYRVERTSTSYSIWTDPNYVPPKQENSSGSDKKPSGDKNNKPKPNDDNDTTKHHDPDKGHWHSCMQFLCAAGDGSVSPDFGIPGNKPNPNYDSDGNPKNSATNTTNPNQEHSWVDGPTYDAHSSQSTVYLGSGRYQTITTTVYSYNETKTVKIADANVAANAYATEIAAYSRIALQPGSRGNLVYDVNHSKFWQTTPSYWTDGGKETISNDSSYPYSFVSESQSGAGKTNTNLYAVIKQKDKFYNVIHGYPDITEIDVSDPNGYPNDQPENCVETDKKVCSQKGTPVINIPIDINENEPQTQLEIDRFVHLTKDRKKEPSNRFFF